MNPLRWSILCLLCVMTCVVVSCFDEEPQEDVRQDIINDWASGIILPGFSSLVDASTVLAQTADPFCQSPDESGLEASRQAWWDARGAWKKLEPFYFGPFKEAPARLGATIDFWPARTADIENMLSGDAPITAEGIGQMGATVRGFPVIEYLLYGEGDMTLSAFQSDSRRCDFLVASTADMITLAEAFHTAWREDGGGYVLSLTQPESGEFMDVPGAMSELVNRMGYALENIRRDRLGKPLGDDSGTNPKPTQVESYYSGRSLQDIRDVLSTLERQVHGSQEPRILGLVDHPSLAKRPSLVQRFDAALDASRTALNAIPEPLSEHLDQGDRVRAAYDELGQLQRVIQADLMNALGLSRSFNDADGD